MKKLISLLTVLLLCHQYAPCFTIVGVFNMSTSTITIPLQKKGVTTLEPQTFKEITITIPNFEGIIGNDLRKQDHYLKFKTNTKTFFITEGTLHKYHGIWYQGFKKIKKSTNKNQKNIQLPVVRILAYHKGML